MLYSGNVLHVLTYNNTNNKMANITTRAGLIYRLAGLFWVTCMGMTGHLLQLKVHVSHYCMQDFITYLI